jgi:hypothetical protein
LDKGQVAMIAAKVTERRKGGRPGQDRKLSEIESFPSASDAAKAAGVSVGAVSEAIDVLEFDEECGASLAKQVERGERSLWNVHAYVRHERERLQQHQRAIKKLSSPLRLCHPSTPPTRAGNTAAMLRRVWQRGRSTPT